MEIWLIVLIMMMIIIIVEVKQDHSSRCKHSPWSQRSHDPWEPTRGGSRKTKLVRCVYGTWLCTDGKGAQCIMGSPSAVWAYSSISTGWFGAYLSTAITLSSIKEEHLKPAFKCEEGVCLQNPNLLVWKLGAESPPSPPLGWLRTCLTPSYYF